MEFPQQLIDTERKIFQSGVGDGNDLQLFSEQSREHETQFQVDFTLSGKEITESEYYPKMEIDYNITAEGKKQAWEVEAEYDYDINLNPSFIAQYELNTLSPIDGDKLDSYEGESTISVQDGQKELLGISADGSMSNGDSIDREVEAFDYTSKMVTHEESAIQLYRYSKLDEWQEEVNTNITNEQTSSPDGGYSEPIWDIEHRKGKLSIINSDYSFTYLYSNEDLFHDENFTVKTDVDFYLHNDGIAGINFCIEDKDNFYFAGFNHSGSTPELTLYKVENGNLGTPLATEEINNISTFVGRFLTYFSQKHTLRVDVLFDNIKVYLDDDLVFDIEEQDRIQATGFGLASYRTGRVSFSDISYDRYNIFEDTSSTDYIKKDQTEKHVSSNSFNDIFAAEYDNRVADSNVVTSYDDLDSLDILPDRDFSLAEFFFNVPYNEFTDTNTTELNDEVTVSSDWISDYSAPNTTEITLLLEEVAERKGFWFWRRSEFDFNFAVYYQEKSEDTWTRQKTVSDHTKSKNVNEKIIKAEAFDLDRGQYRWKVEASEISKRLNAVEMKEKINDYFVGEPYYVISKKESFTEVDNSFVQGDNTKNHDNRPQVKVDNPNDYSYPALDIEIVDISPVNNYDSYGTPITFEFGNGTQTLSSDSGTLYCSTDFQLTKNETGIIEAQEIDPVEMPTLEEIATADSSYDGTELPGLEDITDYDDDNPEDNPMIKITLVDNSTEADVYFERTSDLETVYHEVNFPIVDTQDKIVIFPDTSQVEPIEVDWSKVMEFSAVVNGFIRDSVDTTQKDGIVELTATLDGREQDVEAIPNRGTFDNEDFIFPEENIAGSVKYIAEIEDINYYNYIIFDKEEWERNKDSYPDAVIMQADGNTVVIKELVPTINDNADIIFTDNGDLTDPALNETDYLDSNNVEISSDFMVYDYGLSYFSRRKEITGEVSLLEPVFKKTVPAEDQTLEDFFNETIPENTTGDYSIITEVNETQLSVDYVEIEENTWEVIVEFSNVMDWQPYVHNGYFYLVNEENNRPEEYYLYAYPKTEIIAPDTGISPDTVYDINDFYSTQTKYMQQLSPMVVTGDSRRLRKALFFDEDDKMSITNTETLEIQKETEPAEINIINADGREINITEIEDNIIYLEEEYITEGETLDVDYSYLRSSTRETTLDVEVVDDRFLIELPETYINSIYLSYADIHEDVTLDIDATIEEINENFIELNSSEDLAGTEVTVEYKLKDSYRLDLQQDPPKIEFSDSYDEIEVTWENSLVTPYLEVVDINLNPHINDIHEGFLYITDEQPKMGHMVVDSYPSTIYSDGEQKAYLKVKVLDLYNNPFYNPTIEEGIEVSTDLDSNIEIIDKHGDVIEGTATPDINGNFYLEYQYLDTYDHVKDTVNITYGDISTETEILINDKVRKDFVDETTETNIEEDIEYGMRLTSDIYRMIVGKNANIKARLYKDMVIPLENRDITFTIKNKYTQTETVKTVTTNDEGVANLNFTKNNIESSIVNYEIKSEIDFADIDDISFDKKLKDIILITVLNI